MLLWLKVKLNSSKWPPKPDCFLDSHWIGLYIYCKWGSLKLFHGHSSTAASYFVNLAKQFCLIALLFCVLIFKSGFIWQIISYRRSLLLHSNCLERNLSCKTFGEGILLFFHSDFKTIQMFILAYYFIAPSALF